MFVKSRVCYIVGDSFGDSKKIYRDLQSLNLFNKFYPRTARSNDRFLSRFFEMLPPEAVFSLSIVPKNSNKYVESFVSLPFNSSHFSLPLKHGEIIWIYKHESKNDSSNDKSIDINSYHMSRVHGSLFTEDTGYCYLDREETVYNIYNTELKDTKDRIDNNLKAQETSEFFRNVDFFKNTVYDLNTSFNTEESLDVANTSKFKSMLESYSLGGSRRYINKETDLSLAGTYNTQILFTNTNSTTGDISKIDENCFLGKIEITSGKKDALKRKTSSVQTSFSVLDNNHVKLNKTKSVDHYNNIGSFINNGIHKESLKGERFFVSGNDSNLDMSQAYVKESKISENLSTILVSSASDEIKNILSLSSNVSRISNINNELKEIEKSYIYEFKVSKDENNNEEEKLTEVKFFTKIPVFDSKYEDFKYSMNKNIFEDRSSILLSSDRIGIVTHNTPESEIALIKQSSSSFNNKTSQIKIDKGHCIIIDGRKILIGDYERDDYKGKNNGEDACIYLGLSEDSQSLVMGEQLKSYLLEMIDVERKDIENTREMFDFTRKKIKEIEDKRKEYFENQLDQIVVKVNLISAPLITAGTAPLQSAALGEAINSLKDAIVGSLKSAVESSNEEANKKLEELNKNLISKQMKAEEVHSMRLKHIADNIDKILSKFTKTS